ncbi:MAG: hypothetical protein HFI07_14620 [Lachnospiraceae bacterium]|nr:hypothetical protein [Lachnospiraceae bacterium]
MKEKAVIFGAGSKAKMSIKELLEKYEIVAFLDNDPSVWGGANWQVLQYTTPRI